MQITDETPIAFLTVGQLKEVLSTMLRPVEVVQTQTEAHEEYAYGMNGIAELFQCSLTTAWRLKKNILKPAIIQHGRLFMIEKKTAIRLVAESKHKSES